MASSRKQGRNFDGVTYLPHEILRQVLDAHWEQIDWYAFVLHDQDKLFPLNPEDNTLKTPHTHIVLRTYRPYPRTTVRNWFYTDYVDEKGERVNTLFDFTKNPPGALRYLMHMDQPYKHPYPRESVITNHPDFDVYIQDNDFDDCTLYSAAKDLNKGFSHDYLCKHYGRDYIIHFKEVSYMARSLRDEDLEFKKIPNLIKPEELFNVITEQSDSEILIDWDLEKEQ